jgi:hypothetical protein
MSQDSEQNTVKSLFILAQFKHNSFAWYIFDCLKCLIRNHRQIVIVHERTISDIFVQVAVFKKKKY